MSAKQGRGTKPKPPLQVTDLGDLGTGVRLRPMEAIDRAMDHLTDSVKALCREAKWSSELGKACRQMVVEFTQGDHHDEAMAKVKDMAIFHCLKQLSAEHWQYWFIKTCMEHRVHNWANIFAKEVNRSKPPDKSKLAEITRQLIELIVAPDETNGIGFHGVTRFFVIDIVHSPDIEWKITDRCTILKSIAEDFHLAPPPIVPSEAIYGELMGYHLLEPGVYLSGNKRVYVSENGEVKSQESNEGGTVFTFS